MQSKPYCLAPFKSVVIDTDGTLKPCCDFINHRDETNLVKIKDYTKNWGENYRQAMNQHTKLPGCSHCISKESLPDQAGAGIHFKNVRAKFNSIYKNADHMVEEAEIRFGNYCNLKCIMCGDYASSSISAEYLKFKKEYNSVNVYMEPMPTVSWWEDPVALSNVKSILSNVKYINFAGGEPLLTPAIVDILQILDKDKIKSISMNTNLTKLSDKILHEFRRLKNVFVIVSLEGIGKHNDYIRFGSSWGVIDKHINILRQEPTVRLAFNHVLQHTSVYSLPALISYAEDKNISLMLNDVYYGSYPEPGVLTLNSVPAEAFGKFKDWLDNYSGPYKQKLIAWSDSYNFDAQLNEKYNKYIAVLDKIRGMDFKSVFESAVK